MAYHRGTQNQVKEENTMTHQQSNTIEDLRAAGLTYAEISAKMSLKLSTVKMFFSRKKKKIEPPRCDQCHRPLVAISKKARFCSTSCRFKWHESHLEDSPNREKYIHNCHVCGKTFYSSKAASFCSRPCYYQSRRKVAANHE